MKKIVALLLLLSLTLAWGDEVKVELKPGKPVAGEVFQAFFRIYTDSSEEPSINFVPSGVEVVGKANQGVSTRTVYANGKLTITREMNFVYDLVSNRVGTASLRDISVQFGDKTLRHPTLTINILKEAEAAKDVFVMVDVPKKELYVGEGIIARYYIYHKFPLSNLDVKKYPKLDNFLKRFLQENEQTERVSVDGEIYLRSLIYAAKLFPEKPGDLKIDSLHLSATVPVVRSNDPFGAFGMARDFKTKSISSDVVTVQVRPLPQPVPENFTGLIGKHDIQLQFGQSRLIVNQPLEVKLTVTGSGALENMSAPKIVANPALEEFESNGDLKIQDANTATKTFDYTYLAKSNIQIPPSKTSLSYFDPASQKYVAIPFDIPEIVVAGGSATGPNQEPPAKNEKKRSSESRAVSLPTSLSSPLAIEGSTLKRWLPFLNLALAAISVLIALGWMLKTQKLPKWKTSVDVPSTFKKGRFELKEFLRWMSPLIARSGKSPLTIIRESSLDEGTKKYFVDILSENDYRDFASNKVDSAFTYKSAYFKNLGKLIESVKNESSSQST
jgi:hypothetical protein